MTYSLSVLKPPPVSEDQGEVFVKVEASGPTAVLGVYAVAFLSSTSPPPPATEELYAIPGTKEFHGWVLYPGSPFKIKVRADFDDVNPADNPPLVFGTTSNEFSVRVMHLMKRPHKGKPRQKRRSKRAAQPTQ